ncbi:MAG: hypothetical protein ACW99U_21050 [Candidatus Thorarchaeota archaeon]|jgi:hypothetical protein
MFKAESVEVELDLMFTKIKWTLVPGKIEVKAAWEIYVELVTRIAVVELKSGEGVLREALQSLYSIFQSTREILRMYGPDVARPWKKAQHTLGELAIIILNYQLRPLLSEWHPRLMEYESRRSDDVSVKEHEDAWEHNEELRDELNKTRLVLINYSNYLAKIARVLPLYTSR